MVLKLYIRLMLGFLIMKMGIDTGYWLIAGIGGLLLVSGLSELLRRLAVAINVMKGQ